MFGKLFGRKRKSDDGRGSAAKDKAIIHLTVPDEVLNPDRADAPSKDMSWLDDAPRTEIELPAPKRPSAPRVVAEVIPEAADPAPTVSMMTPNRETSGRPRFPYGWLVIVEGPGNGEWFPLERGSSLVGAMPGATIHLDFGDPAIKDKDQAALTYDEGRHAFVLDATTAVRVNGVERRSHSILRDGDTFTIGGTSLRLIALCSQNFHWSKDLAAE